MDTSVRNLAILVICAIIAMYIYKTNKKPEYFEDEDDEEMENVEMYTDNKRKESNIQPFSGVQENLNLNNKDDAHIPLGSCGKASSFVSSNLLPKSDPNMEDMSEFAPKLDGKNFVDSHKFMLGSQSQSLRNANYQLRSDPPNPQEAVCPWSISTIAPESRRQLEIGAGN
jgi:hypothetical protein